MLGDSIFYSDLYSAGGQYIGVGVDDEGEAPVLTWRGIHQLRSQLQIDGKTHAFFYLNNVQAIQILVCWIFMLFYNRFYNQSKLIMVIVI